MQKPMTQEQIMAIAGVDTRSAAEKKLLTRKEIVDICKKLLIQSDEFPHLHIPARKLTEKDIIDHTGGAELWTEMRRKNPMYDKQFAKDVEAGRITIKKGFKDPRLE